MNMQYFFSHGTPEAEALKENSPEGRVAILQATKVYEDAVQENKRKVNKALNLPLINAILETNHPRKQQFYDFVTSQKWYLENHENIKLVPDGIEILGDVFCLEDENALDGEGICNDSGYTYFNFDSAQEYAKGQGKRIPKDWSKYIDFLPGNNSNKVKFLLNVLGLSFAGYRSRAYDYCSDQFTRANYWSNTPKSNDAYYVYYLYFNDSSNIYPTDYINRDYGFSLRCLKN